MDFICIPLYETLAQLLPGLQPVLDNVTYNRSQWASLQDKFPEPEDGALASRGGASSARSNGHNTTEPSPGATDKASSDSDPEAKASKQADQQSKQTDNKGPALADKHKAGAEGEGEAGLKLLKQIAAIRSSLCTIS